MPEHLNVSPYLYLPIDRSYHDFLKEHIARLEAEPWSVGYHLAMLREERERIADWE